MSQTIKWKYQTATSWYKITKRSGMFGMGGREEGYWAIQLDREYTLLDGLNAMGEKGYELVAVQPDQAFNAGGGNPGWIRPIYMYIFKKPLDQGASD
jgi:hypothetical protein